MDSLCHPWFTTTNLSYRFPIFEYFWNFRHRLVRYYWYVDLCVFVIWNRVRNELSFWLTFFPECVARVPVSLWGFGQPFAHVRKRSQPFARARYCRAYGKFCDRGHFWRFHMSRSLVSRGRRGTSLHSDVFRNVSKVVLCGRRNTFETFSKDEFQFSWQAQHFRLVVLRVFCESHCHGCVKWRQGANSVAGVTFCEMCWK